MIIRLFQAVFFGDLGRASVLSGILSILGMWFLFKKCGQKQWKALIPCYRDYALAQCADREMEGRIQFIAMILHTFICVCVLLVRGNETLGLLFTFLLLFLELLMVIYAIRISLGLFENLGARKLWVVLFVLFQGIPLVLFGLVAKYQPKKRVPEIDEFEKNYFSRDVSVLQNGLTVNIKDRTAKDFFKKKYLLRDVHMNIKPGSMVLLLGGSGAGKTTLLNAITGYEKANAEITLDGRNIYKEYKDMMYEIGFVPQLDLMRGSDTVYRTLTDAAALRLPQNFSRAERTARVEEVMKIFGLTPVKNSLVDKLSGGQRKRLSISIEFLSNPTLFILDEPDSGLDGVMARELMQQLRMIADQGKIIIVITHTPDRVIDLFDDVIVLAKDEHRTGRLAYYGSIAESKEFFERDSMEKIVKSINRKEEGGDGRADELIQKFTEVKNA